MPTQNRVPGCTLGFTPSAEWLADRAAEAAWQDIERDLYGESLAETILWSGLGVAVGFALAVLILRVV